MRFRFFILVILLLSFNALADRLTIYKDLGEISSSKQTKLLLSSEWLLGTSEPDFLIKNITVENMGYAKNSTSDTDILSVTDNAIIIKPEAVSKLSFDDYTFLITIETINDSYILFLTFAFEKVLTLKVDTLYGSSLIELDFEKQPLNCQIMANCDWELYVSMIPKNVTKSLELVLSQGYPGDSPSITLSDKPQKFMSGSTSNSLQEFEMYINLAGDYRKFQTGVHNLKMLFKLVAVQDSN